MKNDEIAGIAAVAAGLVMLYFWRAQTGQAQSIQRTVIPLGEPVLSDWIATSFGMVPR